MWANLAREENALLSKYLVKTRGSTQPKFGIAGFSLTAVLQWPSPGKNSRFFQPLSALATLFKGIFGQRSCYCENWGSTIYIWVKRNSQSWVLLEQSVFYISHQEDKQYCRLWLQKNNCLGFKQSPIISLKPAVFNTAERNTRRDRGHQQCQIWIIKLRKVRTVW